MAIVQPSQFDCDKMEQGDIVFVKHRNPLYKFYRKHFLKDKIKIRVRKNWQTPVEYVTYYQEDCTLTYAYELQCVQRYNKEVPCILAYGNIQNRLRTFVIENVEVSLYNIQIKFKNKFMLMFPISFIDNAIIKNKQLIKDNNTKQLVQEQLKFQKYKGYTFENIVKENKIRQWKASYCSVCGKPIIFKFNKEGVKVDNKCECGNTDINIHSMDWDTFAIWYCSQPNSNVKKYYERFWFKKEL